MKTLILLMFVLISYAGYAQKQVDLEPGAVSYSASDSIKTDPKEQTLKLYENINFETNKLKVKADKLFLDQKTNQITVTGLKEFSFAGKANISANSSNKIMKYTIGEDVIFLE